MSPSVEPKPALSESSGCAPFAAAHRGASGERPENTLAAFERALELRVDFIELDVHLSSDGVPVVIHDDDLQRTTNGSGSVRSKTLAELKALDAGTWSESPWPDQRIPTLSEVFASFGGQTRFLIEIKTGPFDFAGIEDKVEHEIRQVGLVDSVVVISFDHWVLRRLRNANPSLATGALYACRPADPVGLARAAGADLLMPHWAFVNGEDVRVSHDAGLSVFPWTVDEPDAIRALVRLGVDGIVSNWPDRVMELRKSAG
jgi:glycerophosphoryl diester phosphodiesterase